MSDSGYEFVDFDYGSHRRKLRSNQISVNHGGKGKCKNYSVTINIDVSELIRDKFSLCRVQQSPYTDDLILVFDNNEKGLGFRVSHCGSRETSQNVCINGKALTEFLFGKFGFNYNDENRILLSCKVKKHIPGNFLALEVCKQ